MRRIDRAAATWPERRGFTLLEVLVAMAITSLTLVTMLATIGVGQRNVALARLQSLGAMLAREKLAKVFVGDYPVLDPKEAVNAGRENAPKVWIDEGEFIEETPSWEEPPDAWRGDFYWQTIIEEPVDAEMEGLLVLTVRVYSKRFRARRDQREWVDYIDEDYRLLVEVVTYKAAHYYAEGDAK
ncbi:MAG: prepilin-type N-terminal cleavage/methylation domain-containing protein [Verrucomicrobia bacterium]|nr:prepilin-type N-terminal cleavage/methylation domain-containing protein [Verrucomicrobiota bacterium]